MRGALDTASRGPLNSALDDLNMKFSANWDAVADVVEFTVQPNLEQFRRLVPNEAQVLDFGCGYGRIAGLLGDLGYAHIRGYDSSVRMIDRGRKLYPTLHLHHLPALPVPEHDEAYDAALCCAVLTTIPDSSERRRVIEELWRLLVPRGILYVVEFLKSPERAYTLDGTFVSSLGPPMKHFERAELLGESGPFNLVEAWEAEDLDLRGKPVRMLHAFWRKDVIDE